MWGMPPPGVKANFTLLQLTALLFGMPAIVAYVIGYDIGACIYGANAVVSFVVHRPNRQQKDDYIDVLDHAVVFIMVVYNAVLFSQHPTLAPFFCALVAAVAKYWTLQLEWRSERRYLVHALMHSYGALGAVILLRPGVHSESLTTP